MGCRYSCCISDLIEKEAVVRGTKALFKMNPAGDSDCPSCACPDPDDERSSQGAYCENGAKALAEEATIPKKYC